MLSTKTNEKLKDLLITNHYQAIAFPLMPFLSDRIRSINSICYHAARNEIEEFYAPSLSVELIASLR